MSRSFMYGTRLQEIEQMMMSVPNFLPRGKGMIIMGKNMIDEKEEFKKCDYCSEFAKGACTASHCLYMTERIGYGLIHYHHIVADRFSDFSNRFFKKRLRQIVRSFRGEWFLSSYHNDRYSYLKESSSLTLKRKSEQLAIIYILSAHEELWDRAKDHIYHKAIELDKINLKGISTNGYALYQAARTIMTGKSYIQITELADDRNDSFRHEPVPQRVEKTRADWSVWRPWWQEYWVDRGHWERDSWTDSDGKTHTSRYWVSNWVDEGWWEFDLNRYSASFSANMNITCDSKSPTATGSTMKSGYGINQKVSASVSTNQSSAVSKPQNVVSYFPEFNYKTYWRLLERMDGGSFEFKKNNYSTYKNRTHFTPVWFPNDSYEVNTWVIDSWTPVGMLSANLTDTLNIRGSVWDDWHIGPLNP